MVPLYNRAYTKEELEVFRMCKTLKENGCKNNIEAEPILRRTFWNIRPSALQTLMKQWFYNREKIDVLLGLSDVQINATNNDGLTNKSSNSGTTNTIA